jgi:DNA-directed RNA polymerase specialized sigma24 family protein
MRDDAELLREYATQRSDPAFAELVRRHLDLVYSVALRKVGGDAHSAQDVAQAVFIALSRQAAGLASRQSLAGWLYLTTHHQAAQFVRSDGKAASTRPFP